MRIHRIRIRNVLGIEELEFEPGRLTVISGRNGAGKTSVIEAIKALSGGHDATLLRKGEESGEVVFVLDDETEITKPIGPTYKPTKVRRDGMKAGQTFVSEILDGLSMNPVEFISAKPQDRAKYVLEAMPLRVSRDQIAEALGELVEEDDPDEYLDEADLPIHALELIARYRKRIEGERRETNRAAKENRTTAEGLADSAGTDESEDDIRAKLARLEQSRIEIDEAINETHSKATAKVDKLREDEAAEIEKIREAYAARREEVFATLRLDTQDANAELAEITAQIAASNERLEAARRAVFVQKTRDDLTNRAVVFEAQSRIMTKALDRLDALRLKLVSETPLNVTIGDDGEVYHDGIPFARLNKAAQMRFCVELAMLRAGRLPLILMDGLEALDAEQFEALAEEAQKHDVHIIGTKVSNDDLEVRSE